MSNTPSHYINPTILREYDIRGVIGENLSERDATPSDAHLEPCWHRRGERRPVLDMMAA